MPSAESMPCGVPNSMRSTPASMRRCAWARRCHPACPRTRTDRARPAARADLRPRRRRPRGAPGSRGAGRPGSSTVRSSAAITSRYIATSRRALPARGVRRPGRPPSPRRPPHRRHPRATARSSPRCSRCRTTSTIAGFALPPTLISSAISPASAMPSGPHDPDQDRRLRSHDGVSQPHSGLHAERASVVAASFAAEELLDHADRVAQVRDRRRRFDPDRLGHDPFASPRYARPPDAASTAANWPAISYGCRVYGFQHAHPRRIRDVAPPSRAAPRWRLRTAGPRTRSRRRSRAHRRGPPASRMHPGALSVWSPSVTWTGSSVSSSRSRSSGSGAHDPHDETLVRVGAGDEVVALEPVARGQLSLLGGRSGITACRA